MTWTYVFQPRFMADLKRLDLTVAQRVLAKLAQIKPDPPRSMKRLKGSDVFSLRVGDYRVYAHVDMGRRLLEFVRVGHRRNVHER
jgi:mRNA-degrading endonuclease RelE of RelBE toxin-antitoxin system